MSNYFNSVSSYMPKVWPNSQAPSKKMETLKNVQSQLENMIHNLEENEFALSSSKCFPKKAFFSLTLNKLIQSVHCQLHHEKLESNRVRENLSNYLNKLNTEGLLKGFLNHFSNAIQMSSEIVTLAEHRGAPALFSNSVAQYFPSSVSQYLPNSGTHPILSYEFEYTNSIKELMTHLKLTSELNLNIEKVNIYMDELFQKIQENRLNFEPPCLFYKVNHLEEKNIDDFVELNLSLNNELNEFFKLSNENKEINILQPTNESDKINDQGLRFVLKSFYTYVPGFIRTWTDPPINFILKIENTSYALAKSIGVQ